MKPTPHIVVLSSHPENLSGNEARGSDTQVCMVRNLEELRQEAGMRQVDGLIVEGAFPLEPLEQAVKNLVPSAVIVLTEAVTVTKAAESLKRMLGKENREGEFTENHKEVTLDEYVESKFSQFVKAMKVSSGRSLHDTLIRAVERPLIKLALQETNGNQIQAAQLLGMNRNTLRKKITQFKIPIKSRSLSHQHRQPS